MEVVYDPDNWPPRSSSRGPADRRSDPDTPPGPPHALTIGVFDGVHVGHRLIIDRVRAVADRLDVGSALVTFDTHPAKVLRPELAPKLLAGLDYKLELLEEAGLDTVVVVPFNTDRAGESAEDFVHSILISCLNARAVIVGEDFHFGKGRLGNVALLAEMGRAYGFEVHGHALVPRPSDLLAGPSGARAAVSSTAIRKALSLGEVATAELLLGRTYEVRGQVAAGDRRGRTIGFPTANVMISPGMAVPADGVYAGWYVLPDGTRHGSAINVGRRPTFYEQAEYSLVEAHLLDFDGDLYDRPARVQFVSRLRNEQRFDGIDQLKAQLEIDVENTRRVLAQMADRGSDQVSEE